MSQTFPPEPAIITIRGQEYRRNHYDWYIDAALELAPADWPYEDVVRLRNALRENYQHGYNLSVHYLAGDSDALHSFVKLIGLLEGCCYE